MICGDKDKVPRFHWRKFISPLEFSVLHATSGKPNLLFGSAHRQSFDSIPTDGYVHRSRLSVPPTTINVDKLHTKSEKPRLAQASAALV